MRISDWSSDVCSSDLAGDVAPIAIRAEDLLQPVDVLASQGFVEYQKPVRDDVFRVGVLPDLLAPSLHLSHHAPLCSFMFFQFSDGVAAVPVLSTGIALFVSSTAAPSSFQVISAHGSPSSPHPPLLLSAPP